MNYLGSYLLKPIADRLGIPIYHFNFLFSEYTALLIGLVFRHILPPINRNIRIRHFFNIIVGIGLSYFCFGFEVVHILLQTIVSYLALKYLSRQYAHVFVISFSMTYLCSLHLVNQYFKYCQYTFDITSPMMITTQKITALAFSYYDGLKSEEKLTVDQKTQVIKVLPSFLEFFSYIFNFQGIIVGPLCFYRDYIEFITGENFTKHQGDMNHNKFEAPSVKKALIVKLIMVALFSVLFLRLEPFFPVDNIVEMTNKPIYYRMFYQYVSGFLIRTKFYAAWTLADAVNNASGLGFNGYDEQGNPKWDLITNINILNLELSMNIKSVFGNWNTQTQLWLRRIVYDRIKTSKTLSVFFFSAIWHGFYPGYYFTFILCALMVHTGRLIRNNIRPIFQVNKFMSIFYDILTWTCTTYILFAYTAFSFFTLKFWDTIHFYNSWYWLPQIIVVILTITLPKRKPYKIQENIYEKKIE